jgi:gamma-D-glutamyl-L-lysine dipeptidyl-peptidase
LSRLPFDSVCVADVAALRAEPRDDAEQVTQALRGEPLRVEERRDGWALVRTAYDYPGWVREEALSGDPVAEARRLLGAPYEWGGMTERGVDCSGLVHVAFRRAGRLVPRDAHQQEAAARSVSQEELQPGDLVCFGEPGAASHIGFWVGDGRIIHATDREGAHEVIEERLEDIETDKPIRFARL